MNLKIDRFDLISMVSLSLSLSLLSSLANSSGYMRGVVGRAGTIQIQIQIFSRFEGFKDNYLHLYSYIKKIHFKINLQNLIQRYKHLKINLNDLIKWQIHLKTDLHNLIQQENFGLQTCCFTKIIHLRYYVFGYFS